MIRSHLRSHTIARTDLPAGLCFVGGVAVKGEPRADLTLSPMDLLIAAHAVSLRVRLVTNNVKEFKHVPGLRVENWV